MADRHDVTAWLTLEGRPARWNRELIGEVAATKLTRNKPATLRRNEVAVKVKLTIPDAVFTRPALSAHIEVPESAALTGEVVATVADVSSETPPLLGGEE